MVFGRRLCIDRSCLLGEEMAYDSCGCLLQLCVEEVVEVVTSQIHFVAWEMVILKGLASGNPGSTAP